MNRNRRKLQFGLRKLLLWTAVIAVYLAVAKTQRWDPVSFAVVTSWLAVLASARLAFGAKAAGVLSALGGAILGACLGWVAGARQLLPLLLAVVLAGVMFFVFGFILFGIMELAVRAINWADNILAARTPEDSPASPAGLDGRVPRLGPEGKPCIPLDERPERRHTKRGERE